MTKLSHQQAFAPGWNSGEEDTVTAGLARAVRKWPDKTFLNFPDQTFTYREFDLKTNRMAHGLASLGVKPGQAVTTILDNNPDAVLVWFAISKLGAVSVPVNTAYKGEFLRHQMDDSGAEVVIAEADYVERIAAVIDGLPKVRTVLHRENETPKVDLKGRRLEPLDKYKLKDDSRLHAEVKPGDLAMLIYTAGTTGPSKGCMISHNYTCNLARQMINTNDHNERDILWTPLPLFHLNATSTVVVASMLVGGTAAISPRFSVSHFWQEVERTGATMLNVLGSMIPLVANMEENEAMKRCYGQVRAVRGAPFPPELQEKWSKRFGIEQVAAPGYGTSEASLVTNLPVGEPNKPGASGKRIEDFDVRIVDDDDKELGPNERGEIIVRPLKPHIMFEGYWNRPQATLDVFRNMWYHTGDIGMFDEDGYFFFVDRKKDYLRRRGENISSFEMESAFMKHPDIEEVAVHAVFSEFTEDDVKVTAKLKPGTKLTEEALAKWAIDNVPYFAIPRYIEFRDELPKNPVGRVLKYRLRDEGKTPSTWDMEESALKNQIKKR